MNSIQQVVLGAFCVVAAFVFGSYINSNPSLGTPVGQETESRLTADTLTVKLPEPMPVMRHRTEPSYQLDESPAENAVVSKLPDPSELNIVPVEIPQLALEQTQRHTESMKQSPTDRPLAPAPDFSHLSDAVSDRPKPETDLTHSMPAVRNSMESSLKNLADSFRQNSDPNAATLTQIDAAEPPGFDAETPQVASKSPAQDVVPIESSPNGQRQPQATISGVEPVSPSPESDLADESTTQEPAQIPAAGSNQIESRAGLDRVRSLAVGMPGESGSKITVDVDPQAQAQPAKSVLSRIDSNPKRQKVSRLPFQLTENGRAKLVRWKRSAARKLTLQTTEFVPHQVDPGETLQSISMRYFGRADYYLDIYLANRDRLHNPVDVPDGTVLRIPVYDD